MKKSLLFKFGLYILAAVLINLVSLTLFFRIDLTANKIYSLSGASKRAVSSLEEPLTIRAFFSENLPQPYNNLPQEVRDMLEEYSLAGGKNFNYQIYTINKDGTSTDKNGRNIKDLAESYSIYPVQIQNIQSDEVKLQNAYMGIVLQYGNMSETIGSLATVKNLEYQLTTSIYKITQKISALLALKKPIKVNLYLSSSLFGMSSNLAAYPATLKSIVADLNKKNYNKLVFEDIDPDKTPLTGKAKKELSPFNLKDASGKIKKVYAAVSVENKNVFYAMNLLNKSLFGYTLIEKNKLKDSLDSMIESSLGISKEIGYMVDYGTLPLYQNPYARNAQNQVSLNNLHRILSDTYTVQGIDISKNGIPKGLKTLLIVGPKKKFSQWDLYQIDQYIMAGNSVAFLVDTYNAVTPPNQNPYYPQPPTYIPVKTGLNDLLKHYGVIVKHSYIMDENCYINRSQTGNGGYKEVSVYFAPKILSENINKKLPFIKNIKGLITLNNSPIEIEKSAKGRVKVLFTSSAKSWEMKRNINLYNPMMITPPGAKKEKKYPLAVLIEGSLTSYFNGKAIPQRPVEKGKTKKKNKENVVIKTDTMNESNTFIPKTDHGKIFVIGTSAIVTDNLLDKNGSSPNAVFVANLMDHLNGRDDFAVMRSKGQLYNPLIQTTPRFRSFVKSFNIVVLPVLVIITGIFVWLFWISRRKKIERLFNEEGDSKNEN